MEQVFRIEIPVEAVDKTDTAALQHLESVLQKIVNSMKQSKASVSDVFEAIERGASKANSSLSETASNANKVGDSYDKVASSAEDAGSTQSSAAKEAENATDKLEDSVSDTSDSYKETGEAAQGAGQKSGSAFTQASSSTDRFTQRVEKSNRTLRGMFKEKFQLILAAVDRASPVLKSIWTSAKNIAGKAWNVAVRMKDFITAPFRKLYNMITSPITIALSVAGIGLSASDIVSTYNDFETGMSAVKALTGATNSEFTTLKETAKELGASTSFSASQASEGMQYLAMAGWDTSQIVAAMPGLLDLAAAGATDLGTAADIVSDVMTAMSMSADEASRAADVFAKTATSSNTTIEGLGETMKYAAPIAHSFGMSLEEVSALAGLMANAGIKGSQSGTALRASLLRMSAPTSEMLDTMTALGISFTDSNGNMKKSAEIVSMLSKSFSGLSQSQRLEAAQTLFGTEAASAWLGVINQGPEAYNEMSESLYNCAGAAEEMANIRLDNLSGDLEELGGAVETAKLELMDKLDPYLRAGVQWLTERIPVIQAKLEGVISTVIDKGTALVSFLKDVFNSDDYQNADGFAEKFFVAWDKIIAEPFTNWWSNGGQDTILKAVSSLGENIGKLLHGIIAGIFAGLRGEEIDFEGMNLTGIAKAGAETAKAFVTSFKDSFNLGGLIGEMPGTLKAGLIGFGSIKAGQAGLGVYKAVTGLKAAFAGVTATAGAAATATATVGKTAATAAVGVSKSTVILGGLKTALAAIPVWGWVAAAAVTALAVGIKLYTDEQARNKQQILDLEQTVEGHISTYRREAEEINAITGTVEAIREIKINATYEGPGPQEMQDLQTQLAMLGSRENQLEYLISNGGTDEQIAQWQAELESIHASQAEAAAKLAGMKQNVSDIISLVAELNALEDPDITITATLNKYGIDDEEDVQLIIDLANAVTTKSGFLTEFLTKIGLSYEDFLKLTSLKNDIESKSGFLTEFLTKIGLSYDDFLAVTQLKDDVDDKTGRFKQYLNALGVTPEAFSEATALGKEVGFESGAFLQALAQLGISPEEFQTATALSDDVDTAAGILAEALFRLGVTPEQFAEATALSDDVSDAEGKLTEELERLGVTPGQFRQATDLYDDVLDAEGKLTEELERLGVPVSEFKEACGLSSMVVDKSATITITAKLKGYMLTTLGIASLQTILKNSDALEQKVRITLDKETSLTSEQIDEYVNTLKGNKTREIEIELQLDGAAMTYQQIAAINSELQTIKQRKVELDVVVGEGTATAEQIEEYTQLLSREAAIELMLTGVNLTPEEIGALTEEWDGLKTIDSEIYVHMSEAGLDETEVDLLKQHIDGIGDATAIITVALSNTSPEAAEQQKAALMEQYERLSGELESSFGIQLSAEQLASGQFDSLIYGMNGEWRENMQRADWYTLKTANEEETQGVVEPAQQLISDNQQRIAELQSQASAQSEAVAPAVNMLSLIESLGAEYDSRVRTARDDPEAFNEWREGTYNPALFEAYKAYVHASPETSWVGDDQISEMWSGFLNNGADTPMHETLLGMFGGWDSIFGEQPNVAQQDVAEVEAMNAEIARLQAEIDTANAGLASAYGEEKDIATSESFIGSDYFGKPIEEIAANYATLDEAAQGMFLQALSALETLNSQTDYISDSDKTSASEMLDLAAKSEIMASIQTQVDGISLKYGEMSNEDLLKLDGLEEGKTTLEAINGALDALGLDKIESMTQIKDALESIAGVDMSKFSVDAAATAIQSLTGDANSGKTSVDALRTALANLDGKTATTTINEYTNKITTYKTNGSPAQNAAGGIYDGAFLSWVAEDGPEAIIPLGSKRRGRGIDLWLQAGEMLGVSEFADGGIMAPYTGALEDLPADYFDDDDGDGSPKPIRTGSEGGHGGNSFSISVSANPTFQITGGDNEDILDKLKGKQKELAELFGGALAEQLEDIVANMV